MFLQHTITYYTTIIELKKHIYTLSSSYTHDGVSFVDISNPDVFGQSTVSK